MAKFRFSLQKLLQHRELEVDLAQRDFATAQLKEREQIAKLDTLSQELQNAVLMRGQLQGTGGNVAEQIQSIHDYSVGQKIRVERQQRVVQGLRVITEQKRLVLVEAMKQVKTLEKLREKKKLEFDQEEARKETREMDDLIVMRHGRKSS